MTDSGPSGFRVANKSLRHRQQASSSLFHLRNLLAFAALTVLTCSLRWPRPYSDSTIVVFGDSLSDTGNFLHLSEAKYGIPVPGPLLPLEDYTLGRFTDGPDTTPAAQKYFGVWIEQLAASLPGRPLVFNSLDGGTDYAYGDATTANGTSPIFFGLDNIYSVQVENIGQQITDYLATHPHIDSHTLFVVWGGADDILGATSADDIFNAAVRQTLNLQRLIHAGATQFLIPNQPPARPGAEPQWITRYVGARNRRSRAIQQLSRLRHRDSQRSQLWPPSQHLPT